MHVKGASGDGDWLYAIGDANGRALLTHMGKYQARIATDCIDGRDTGPAWADLIGSPRVIFTDPQIAAVGLTEEKAREQGPRPDHGQRARPRATRAPPSTGAARPGPRSW